MVSERYGRVVKGLGGLFEVRLEDNGKGERVSCRAKGNLKRDEEKVLVGDLVSVSIDDSTPDGVVISEIKERKNSFCSVESLLSIVLSGSYLFAFVTASVMSATTP